MMTSNEFPAYCDIAAGLSMMPPVLAGGIIDEPAATLTLEEPPSEAGPPEAPPLPAAEPTAAEPQAAEQPPPACKTNPQHCSAESCSM
jgi:hypothetical protein